MPPTQQQPFFFDTNFWANLRRQAATILTSSLSVAEQQEMMTKMGHTITTSRNTNHSAACAVQDELLLSSTTTVVATTADTMTVQKSIEEAVAEARMQEAVTQTAKWNREKEQILAAAEQAARQRVESELRIVRFREWQNEVHLAKSLSSSSSSSSNSSANDVSAVAGDLASRNHSSSSAHELEQTTDQNLPLMQQPPAIELVHPLLGAPLVDLLYKRVHLVSAKQLATIPVWKKQRIYRHDRANSMAQDKLKSLHLGMPGVIGLHEVRTHSHIIDSTMVLASILFKKNRTNTANLCRIKMGSCLSSMVNIEWA
jgi:hypothetical protein